MPKISVIVPVYNVEKYLNRCIDSILDQTFVDFECILVDDGSPDNCGKICDEYANKDERIRVIHKENGGLSDARNAGIESAQGEYLSFIDSDDWIHPQMLEILYDGIVKNDVMLSVCAYEETKDEKPFEKIENVNFDIRNGIDFLTEDNVTAVVAWNKLYNKNLFEDIRYPIGKLHEDEFVTYKILYKAGNIAFCNEKMYMYFVNYDGITKGKITAKRIEDAICAWEERDAFIREHGLVQYRDWSEKMLLDRYNMSYRTGGELCSKKYRKQLLRKMRRILIFHGKRLGVSFKPWYYEIAFPKITRILELFIIANARYKEQGIKYCFKKIILYFLNR